MVGWIVREVSEITNLLGQVNGVRSCSKQKINFNKVDVCLLFSGKVCRYVSRRDRINQLICAVSETANSIFLFCIPPALTELDGDDGRDIHILCLSNLFHWKLLLARRVVLVYTRIHGELGREVSHSFRDFPTVQVGFPLSDVCEGVSWGSAWEKRDRDRRGE